MTKSNNSEAFSMHLNMMQTSGIWPKENPSVMYKLRTLTTWILSVVLSLTMVMAVIINFNGFIKLSEDLFLTISITTYVIKLLNFTHKRKHFLNMVEFLRNPVFSSYSDDLGNYMATTIKISTFIATVYKYLCFGVSLLFIVYPIFDNKPLPLIFPFEYGDYRLLIFAFQIISVTCCIWNNSCLDTLLSSLMGIAAGQLDVLTEKIVRAFEESVTSPMFYEETDLILKNLEQCTKHHSAIIEFIESIEDVFTVGIFFQCLASIAVICNTLFQFLFVSVKSWQFVLVINYFCVMTIQLSMYCWYGNEIMWKSVQIVDACYKSGWYYQDSSIGKYLFIIMERSKKPLSITALKFSKLSLPTLAKILQWSYSYFALLVNMYTKKYS